MSARDIVRASQTREHRCDTTGTAGRATGQLLPPAVQRRRPTRSSNRRRRRPQV